MPFATICLCAGILFPLAGAQPPGVNPYPPPIINRRTLREWTFDDGPQGWRAVHDCTVAAADGSLKIVSKGRDPYLAAAVKASGPLLRVRMRVRSGISGRGQFFWTTDRHPRTAEAHSRRFDLNHDGRWHEYEVLLEIEGELTALRLDPGWGDGTVEIDWIRLSRARRYPLVIECLATSPAGVDLRLRNLGAEPVAFTLNGGA